MVHAESGAVAIGRRAADGAAAALLVEQEEICVSGDPVGPLKVARPEFMAVTIRGGPFVITRVTVALNPRISSAILSETELPPRLVLLTADAKVGRKSGSPINSGDISLVNQSLIRRF